MNSLVHASARLCACAVGTAMDHLTTADGMARWCLGVWDCREVDGETDLGGHASRDGSGRIGRPPLFTGRSLYDGATCFVQVTFDPADGVIDYAVGLSPGNLVSRIGAHVVDGVRLGHPPGTCVVTLFAWRLASMDDARWQRLASSHETELDLIQAQLGAAPVLR